MYCAVGDILMIPRQGWKLSRRRRIQPKVSAYQEWPQKQILKKSWIQPFWTPSKDISWGKDHDQDHLSHLTRIPNSKSSNWKGFKLKKWIQSCFCFWPRPLTLVPSLVKAKGKMYENQTGWRLLQLWCSNMFVSLDVPHINFKRKCESYQQKGLVYFKEPRVSFNFLSAALGASGVYFTCTRRAKQTALQMLDLGHAASPLEAWPRRPPMVSRPPRICTCWVVDILWQI